MFSLSDHYTSTIFKLEFLMVRLTAGISKVKHNRRNINKNKTTLIIKKHFVLDSIIHQIWRTTNGLRLNIVKHPLWGSYLYVLPF